MLTSRNLLDDKLKGFDSGVDDYLVKPFELAELKARIHALTRRYTTQASLLDVADLQMDSKARWVRRGQRTLTLSPAEWQLLELLMRESPNPVPRQKIEQHIWQGEPPSSDAYKMLLYRLRKIVDDRAPVLLHTVRGFGVCLKP